MTLNDVVGGKLRAGRNSKGLGTLAEAFSPCGAMDSRAVPPRATYLFFFLAFFFAFFIEPEPPLDVLPDVERGPGAQT